MENGATCVSTVGRNSGADRLTSRSNVRRNGRLRSGSELRPFVQTVNMTRSHFRTALALVALLTSASSVSATGPRKGWKDYVNVRYGFAICYPTGLLVAQGESPSGDGQKFLGRGGAELEVFSAVHEGETLAQSLDGEIASFTNRKGDIKYRSGKKDRLTASGTFRDQVFYSRIIKQDDRFLIYQIKYPSSRKDLFDAIVPKLNACFGKTRAVD